MRMAEVVATTNPGKDTARPEMVHVPHRIILFGELLADIFPDQEVIGGAPFNVARHLQSFGMHPLLISRMGKDRLGEKLVNLVGHFGMDRAGIQVDAIHPTGQVRVHMEGADHSFEILPDQAYDYINAKPVRRIARTHQPSLIYFGTLAQRHAVSREALQMLLNSADAPRMLDLNLRAPWYDTATLHDSLSATELVKLNGEELATLASLLELPCKNAQEQAECLMARFPIQKLLVTEGPDGAWLLSSDGSLVTVTGKHEAPVIDTVGAGDAFSAVFIFGFLSAWPAALILKRADAFARAICGIQGAVPINEGFYEPFLRDWEAH